MILLIVSCILFYDLGLRTQPAVSEPIVTLTSGLVKGYVASSTTGKTYYGFRAIPFAKLPIRFKPPEPVEKWDGIFEATQEGESCAQFDPLTDKTVGAEDCLIINVYTPQAGALPVLFSIHAGAFIFGSGLHSLYGPQNFMDHPIVLVTFNYRLGILGFLNTEDENAFGNYGMLDQVLALKWVQENIRNFGGDRNKVTIFGNSAGSASVIYQMLSPLSKGLFHKAIAQSGTATSNWAFNSNPLKLARTIARKLNCSNWEDAKQIVQCLSIMPYKKLIKESHKLRAPRFILPCNVNPTIEAKGGPGFLTEDPVRLVKEGRIANKVPLIIGRVATEASFFYNDFILGVKSNKYYELQFQEELPMILSIPTNSAKAVEAIADKYYKNTNLDDDSVFKDVSIQILSDSLINADVAETAEYLSKTGFEVYAYVYNHIGQYCFKQIFNNKCDNVSSHADELLIQFQVEQLKSTSAADIQMASIINSLWVSFASNSELYIEKDEKWPRFNVNNRRYVELSLQPVIKEGSLSENMTFWKETLPRLTKDREVKTEL